MPGTFAGLVVQLELVGISFDPATLFVLQAYQFGQLFRREAGLVDDGAVRVGYRDHTRAQLHAFFDGVLRHIAGPGHRYRQAFDGLAGVLEHFFGKVNRAIAGGLGTDQAAAVGQPLAGEHAGRRVGQLLHHARHESDFTGADTNVASRHIGVRPQVAVEFGDERLAEAHDLTVRLAFGVEVRAAFAAAHGQGRQGVLEGLFKGQKFQYGQIDRRVKTHTALVRAYRRAMLDAEAAVDLDASLVIDPGNAKLEGSFGLYQSFQYAVSGIAGIAFNEGPQTIHHFFDCLHELGLMRVARADLVKKLI